MKRLLLAICFLFVATSVMAQTTPAPASSSFSISDILKNVGAKEGLLWDFNGKRGLNFVAATLVEKWNFALDAGLVSTDGLGVAVDYNLSGLTKWVSLPILQYAKFINVGAGFSYRTLTLTGDLTENPKSDNKISWGPVVFAKWNF